MPATLLRTDRWPAASPLVNVLLRNNPREDPTVITEPLTHHRVRGVTVHDGGIPPTAVFLHCSAVAALPTEVLASLDIIDGPEAPECCVRPLLQPPDDAAAL